MTANNLNWAGNYAYRANQCLQPNSIDEIQEIVARSGKVKALGTRHCFNGIADTPATQISTCKLDKILGIDPETKTVNLEGGVRYGELGSYLHQHGYALPNLASLPHISVAGSIGTATHGSGVRCGNLATSVEEIEYVTADGNLHISSRKDNPDTFNGSVVHLGALGIIARLKLKVEMDYQVRQDVYSELPYSSFDSHALEILSYTYNLSLFTDWQSDTFRHAWLKTRLDHTSDFQAPETFFGAKRCGEAQNPVPGSPSVNATDQLGVPGPWHQRLPHFKLEFTPSSGAELQSEYFLPIEHAVSVFQALREISNEIAPLVFITELRTIAADELWISPAYQQNCIGIHFTWKPDWDSVQKLLPKIESILEPFHPRPHWGKLFTLDPQTVKSAFPKFADFEGLAYRYDPHRKFRNDYLDAFFE